MVTAGGDNTIRVWDVKTGKEIVKWTVGKNPSALAVSPDGKVAAVAQRPNHQITLWKLPTISIKKP
jgi:WD40 repeat protein